MYRSLDPSKKRRHSGEWCQGQRYGRGVMKYANGSVYEGNWRKDKKSGQAYVTHSTGKRVIVYFDNDRVLSQAKDINMLHSVTESQILETLGEELAGGKPSILRNIGHIRRLYIRYSSMSTDNQFRVLTPFF